MSSRSWAWRRWVLMSLLCVAMLPCWRLALATELVAYTEESAPYHYTENGKLVGSAVESLQAACDLARISCHISILPWARAYAQTKLQANTMIFSMVRRPDREHDFIWVSPIVSEPVWIFGRPDSPPAANIGELSARRTGVVNGSSGMAILEQGGVPRAAMDLANSSEANFRKLAAHRVDFILGTESRYLLQQQLYHLPFSLTKVLKVGDATSYYAMNPHSDAALVQSLQTALAQLRRDKVLDRIEEKYRSKTQP